LKTAQKEKEFHKKSWEEGSKEKEAERSENQSE
jgi:hypothetical protein